MLLWPMFMLNTDFLVFVWTKAEEKVFEGNRGEIADEIHEKKT